MKPSEIRRELLGQHAALRGEMRETRDLIEHVAPQVRVRTLYEALMRISALLQSHNMYEAALMRDVFPMLDGWGRVRAETMLAEHEEEHRDLYESLLDASTTSDAELLLAKTNALFDHLLEHMELEEKVFLGEDVLSDEELMPDSFGG